jgi:hypothetical protein
MNFPTELQQAASYLSGKVTVCENHEDGRVNSITDEATVIQLLKDKFGAAVEEPKAREWWDVKLWRHPVNIKSSSYSKGAADNFSSKAAVLWALTTLTEKQVAKVRTWKAFQTALFTSANGENNRDYYIITVNKDNSTVHLTSLRSLQKLTPNGNNLPFQIQWKNNTQPVQRTYQEAYNFVIGAYKQSVQKKVSVHSGWEQL